MQTIWYVSAICCQAAQREHACIQRKIARNWSDTILHKLVRCCHSVWRHAVHLHAYQSLPADCMKFSIRHNNRVPRVLIPVYTSSMLIPTKEGTVTYQDSFICMDQAQLTAMDCLNQAVAGHTHASNLWEQGLQLVYERLHSGLQGSSCMAGS